MKELGRVVGYCPTCFIAVGNKELKKQCPKCGQLLFKENILREVDVGIAKQTLSQMIQTTPYPSSWTEYHKRGGNKY